MSPDDPLIGQTVGKKLKVLRRIGTGGMGVVYEVEHLMTHHHRALKVLHSRHAMSAESVARFLREAGVAGRLRTPYVVETLDAGQLEDGSPYVLMELLEGKPLSAIIDADGRLSPERAARLIWQACEGVAAAHDAGIVHRDLKPDNLFVTHDDRGEERVKILDFGISKFSDKHEHSGTLTATGAVMGTPYYLSPEQARGTKDIDGRADVYALGVILYESLSGRRPFHAESFTALVVQIHEGQYEPLTSAVPGLEPNLAALVQRAMHKDREQRFRTVRELQKALEGFLEGGLPPRSLSGTNIALAETAAAASTPMTWQNEPRRTPARGWRAPLAALGVGAMIAGAALVVVVNQGGTESAGEVGGPAPAAGGAVGVVPEQQVPAVQPIQVPTPQQVPTAVPDAGVIEAEGSNLMERMRRAAKRREAAREPRMVVEQPAMAQETPQPTVERPARERERELASGAVQVVVVPFGDVWIDGRRVGTAPVRVELRPGTHTVAVGDGAPSERREVRVVSGEVTRVTFRR